MFIIGSRFLEFSNLHFSSVRPIVACLENLPLILERSQHEMKERIFKVSFNNPIRVLSS